jgi:hypothetical protein
MDLFSGCRVLDRAAAPDAQYHNKKLRVRRRSPAVE